VKIGQLQPKTVSDAMFRGRKRYFIIEVRDISIAHTRIASRANTFDRVHSVELVSQQCTTLCVSSRMRGACREAHRHSSQRRTLLIKIESPSRRTIRS
jgi:hypothetical protein